MTAENPLKWGVLGAANIAIKQVIPAIGSSQLGRVDAIGSRSVRRAEETARLLGIPRWYGSYQDLLDDEDIDAVYIPLPNHLHMEWTLAAAAAGKHVLCEKPLAMSSAAAQTMVEACEDAGVKLMEAFMYRLHPLWGEVRRLVDEGAIGELQCIQSMFSYYNDNPSDIRNISDHGGGALFDIGCYLVNVARMLFDSEPSTVKSAMTMDPAFGVDTLTSAILDFDGRHATFICGTRMEPSQWVELLGSEGRLRVEPPFNIPADQPTEILHYGARGTDPERHVVVAANQYSVQADAFARSISEGRPAPIPPEDAVRNLSVIERIFANAGESVVRA